MSKIVFIIIILTIGLSIMGGCDNSQNKNSVDEPVITTHKSPAKQESVQQEGKFITESNIDILSNNEESEDNKSLQEKFSEEELRVFRLIKEIYQEFEYSDEYVNTSENYKKMVFSKNADDLYFDYYISYDVFYYEGGMINYSFDAGTAYRGFGYYLVVDDSTVIKVEKTIGTDAYEYTVYKNGKKIEGETKGYN